MRNDVVKKCLSLVLCVAFFVVNGCGSLTEKTVYLYSIESKEGEIPETDMYASYKPLSEKVMAIIPEETVTLKVYNELNNKRGVQDGWFGQIMKNLFNVEFEFVDTSDRDYLESAKAGRCDWDFVLLKSHDKLKDCMDRGLIRNLEDG